MRARLGYQLVKVIITILLSSTLDDDDDCKPMVCVDGAHCVTEHLQNVNYTTSKEVVMHTEHNNDN